MQASVMCFSSFLDKSCCLALNSTIPPKLDLIEEILGRYPLNYLIVVVPQFGVLLLKYHPEGSKSHQQTMTHVPKHHRKQEGECNYGVHRCRVTETNTDLRHIHASFLHLEQTLNAKHCRGHHFCSVDVPGLTSR